MGWLVAITFIAWLEASQPANPACVSPYIKMLPEQCHATFNRNEPKLIYDQGRLIRSR